MQEGNFIDTYRLQLVQVKKDIKQPILKTTNAECNANHEEGFHIFLFIKLTHDIK